MVNAKILMNSLFKIIRPGAYAACNVSLLPVSVLPDNKELRNFLKVGLFSIII